MLRNRCDPLDGYFVLWTLGPARGRGTWNVLVESENYIKNPPISTCLIKQPTYLDCSSAHFRFLWTERRRRGSPPKNVNSMTRRKLIRNTRPSKRFQREIERSRTTSVDLSWRIVLWFRELYFKKTTVCWWGAEEICQIISVQSSSSSSYPAISHIRHIHTLHQH